MAALKNKQHELFCQEYLADLNGAAAAVRAGYSEKAARQTASRLLTIANVQARVAELQAERTQRTQITADWVVAGLKAEAEDRGEKSSQSARIRAYELLGKHVGMWSEKKDAGESDPLLLRILELMRAEKSTASSAAGATETTRPATRGKSSE